MKNVIFPQNLKEALIASLPNCLTMVLGMMTLNLWIYGALSPANFMHAFPRIFAAAFILDFFFVGPICMRIVRKYNIFKYMPLIRVGMMAGILTAFAPVLETGYLPAVRNYFIALPRNYIVALALQVFVAMRMGLWVLGRYRRVARIKHMTNVASSVSKKSA